MRELTENELREVQLGILRQFDAYCLAHGLNYQLFAGTLLGAIRHKGFIPWDDDVDVMMPRPDYERFRTLVRADPVGPDVELRSVQTTPHYNAPFCKLIDTRTDGHEDYLRKDIRNGVWIDVFPVDGLPADPAEREQFYQAQEKRHMLLQLASRPCHFTWNPLKLGKRVALYALYHHVDYQKVAAEMDEAARRYPFEDSEECSISVFYARKWTFRKEWCLSVERAPFEELTCNIPSAYNEVLTVMYGDYMTPPPEAERLGHHEFHVYWRDC